ncbi:MAG: FecR family protein [Terracidiphilus sp.]
MKQSETGWWKSIAQAGLALAAACALVAAGPSAAAQQLMQNLAPQNPAPQNQGPQDAVQQNPAQQGTGTGARAVRLSYVEGQVQLSMAGTILAQEAPVNTPLFEGTQIKTSDDGRAEIQFEDGSVARVAPDSSLTLSVLRQGANGPETVTQVNGGLGYFELEGSQGSGSMQVRFGSDIVTSSGFTVLRVDTDNPPGELAVFSGNAHLEDGQNLSLDIHGGETVTLEANGPRPYQLAESISQNSWDQWNSDRDQALTAEEANRTEATSTVANSNNPAWSDLDANGNWYNVPGTGYVWSPYEAENTGWDPYGCGNWVWMPPYGYVWASCESWGFMPYQAGNWGYYDGIGWGWYPGGGEPWWYGGGGGWNYNVRNAPHRFHPPVKPRGGPVMPKGGEGIGRPGVGYQPHPVIAFNRLEHSGSDVALRTRNTPVMVGGNPIAPMQPISPRPFYEHETRGERTTTAAGNGGARYGYTQTPNQTDEDRNVYWNSLQQRMAGPAPGQPVYRGSPQRPSSGAWGARPAPTSPSRSYGGGASRPSGGGNSGGGGHPSGGGGGGGSHVSAGGGGGGGGSHPSGGGRPR